jgi:hypothetical protein
MVEVQEATANDTLSGIDYDSGIKIVPGSNIMRKQNGARRWEKGSQAAEGLQEYNLILSNHRIIPLCN